MSRTDHGDGKQFLRRMQKMPWRRLVIERKPHIAYYQILYIEKRFYKCHTPGLRFSYIFPTIGTDKMTNVDKFPGGGMSTHGIDWAISLLQQFKWNTIKIRLPRLIIKAFYGSKILTILDFFTSRWTNWPLSSGYFGSWGHFAAVESLGNLRKRR